MNTDEQNNVEDEFQKIKLQLRGVGLTAMVVLCAGAIFFHHVEKLKWLDAFYFCTITLTTVGYGDIVPTTDAGKLFTIFYVVIGIGILATFANLLIKRAMVKRQVKKSRRA